MGFWGCEGLFVVSGLPRQRKLAPWIYICGFAPYKFVRAVQDNLVLLKFINIDFFLKFPLGYIYVVLPLTNLSGQHHIFEWGFGN